MKTKLKYFYEKKGINLEEEISDFLNKEQNLEGGFKLIREYIDLKCINLDNNISYTLIYKTNE